MRLKIALAAAFTLLATPALAQECPKGFDVTVPYAPGNAFDGLARIITAKMSEHLRKPVVIANVVGAGGMLGGARVAKAAPDGCSIAFGDVSTFAVNNALFERPMYHPVDNFEPVGLMMESPLLLVARRDLPSDLRQFIPYATARASKMQYGSAGIGTVSHLTCAMFNKAAGLNEVTHVPYRFAGLAVSDLISGNLDYSCVIESAVAGQIKRGSMKALAIFSHSRSPTMQTVPTAREQGIDLESPNWGAVFVPKNTPPSAIAQLHAALQVALNDSGVQRRLAESGAIVVARDRRTPDYLARYVQSEMEKWAAAMRESGVEQQ
jgi:tripartite-type tricarboxylate transporter receptor subunit TctC